MIDKSNLRALKTQLKKIENDSQILKIELSNIQKSYQLKIRLIKELKSKIEAIQHDQTIYISEHAIVRYFERIKGYDIDLAKKEILSEETLILIEKLGGNGSYPSNNFKIIMKDYTVVTVVKR